MVGRFIRTVEVEKLVKLGGKWLNSYRLTYLHILLSYYKQDAIEKILILNYCLKNATTMYLSCPTESCFKMNESQNESQNVSPEINDTPLYEWIKSEVMEKKLGDDLLRVLMDDDQDVHRYIEPNDNNVPTEMIEDHNNHIPNQTSDLFSTIKKRKADGEAVSSEDKEAPRAKKS
ncbi:uncharacterized protein LOC135841390 [Planococcus citri]|uniref:uncharacterized protein LOC135841390 n=1 Tax=Planococcus citri TaxID=170843 RepID=UPI0031F883CF